MIYFADPRPGGRPSTFVPMRQSGYCWTDVVASLHLPDRPGQLPWGNCFAKIAHCPSKRDYLLRCGGAVCAALVRLCDPACTLGLISLEAFAIGFTFFSPSNNRALLGVPLPKPGKYKPVSATGRGRILKASWKRGHFREPERMNGILGRVRLTFQVEDGRVQGDRVSLCGAIGNSFRPPGLSCRLLS